MPTPDIMKIYILEERLAVEPYWGWGTHEKEATLIKAFIEKEHAVRIKEAFENLFKYNGAVAKFLEGKGVVATRMYNYRPRSSNSKLLFKTAYHSSLKEWEFPLSLFDEALMAKYIDILGDLKNVYIPIFCWNVGKGFWGINWEIKEVDIME